MSSQVDPDFNSDYNDGAALSSQNVMNIEIQERDLTDRLFRKWVTLLIQLRIGSNIIRHDQYYSTQDWIAVISKNTVPG